MIVTVEDLAEQLAIRDRFLMRRRMQMTPAQRMEEMSRLQDQARAVLRSSPEGYARFMARNLRQRATDVMGKSAT